MFYKLSKKLRKKFTGTLSPRLAFHALRRKFASDWSDVPTALVAAAGGWVNLEVVVKLYQRPSVEQVSASGALGAQSPSTTVITTVTDAIIT